MSEHTDMAETCHRCGAVGKADERWITADTCDTCSYHYATARFGRTADERRRSREELRARRGLNGPTQ